MTIDLEKLKELCEKAPVGPWHIGHLDENLDHADIDAADGEHVAVVFPRSAQALICEARSAVPQLIAQLEQTNALYESYREEMARYDAEIRRLRSVLLYYSGADYSNRVNATNHVTLDSGKRAREALAGPAPAVANTERSEDED